MTFSDLELVNLHFALLFRATKSDGDDRISLGKRPQTHQISELLCRPSSCLKLNIIKRNFPKLSKVPSHVEPNFTFN